jgi:hypothetical protein
MELAFLAQEIVRPKANGCVKGWKRVVSFKRRQKLAWNNNLVARLYGLALGGSNTFLIVASRDHSLPPFGSFLHFAGKFFDALPHHFSSFEFHRCARRNDKAASGLIRVAPNAGLCQARLKHAKVAQLDGHVARQAIGDLVQSSLNDIKHLMLDHPSLVTDRHDNVAFCELAHLQGIVRRPDAERAINAKSFTASIVKATIADPRAAWDRFVSR